GRNVFGMVRQHILREHGCATDGAARPSGRISALAFLKRHGFDLLLIFCKARERRRARPQARQRNEKPGAECRPGFWRSFGEYALLEDSRYTSQVKNCAAAKSLN